MSFLSNKKKRKTDRLNLIPILDAIFIIIFFLLMSAQFIKFHEIGSDAPNIKTADNLKREKKEPLNLTLEILTNKIVIKIKTSGIIHKTLPLKNNEYDLDELLQIAIALKENNIDDNFVILKPYRLVYYRDIVKIIDIIREIPNDSPLIKGVDKRGRSVQTNKLFDQVIFDTII